MGRKTSGLTGGVVVIKGVVIIGGGGVVIVVKLLRHFYLHFEQNLNKFLALKQK